jgi:hypothetical protein
MSPKGFVPWPNFGKPYTVATSQWSLRYYFQDGVQNVFHKKNTSCSQHYRCSLVCTLFFPKDNILTDWFIFPQKMKLHSQSYAHFKHNILMILFVYILCGCRKIYLRLCRKASRDSRLCNKASPCDILASRISSVTVGTVLQNLPSGLNGKFTH